MESVNGIEYIRTYIENEIKGINAACVLERGSIDKPLTFDVGLIQHSFHTNVFT